MNKTYVIQWKSTVNGRAGRGTKLFEKEEAERLAAELNQEYPQIVHECVEVQPDPSRSQQSREAEAPSTMDPNPLLSVA